MSDLSFSNKLCENADKNLSPQETLVLLQESTSHTDIDAEAFVAAVKLTLAAGVQDYQLAQRFGVNSATVERWARGYTSPQRHVRGVCLISFAELVAEKLNVSA